MQVESKFKSGSIIKWTSQANGVSKEKQGKIVAVLDKNESAKTCIEALSSFPYNLHAASTSLFPRYLIAVKTSDKQKVDHFYAPLVKVIDSRAELVSGSAGAVAGPTAAATV